MKYQGSKSRTAKEIIPILIKDRQPGQYYVEPFCGSASVIQEVSNPRIAADNNYYLIELLRAIQNGWIPPDNITEENYRCVKNNPDDYSAALVGFVGFCCSFSGKFWGGYARGNDNKGKPRNYAAEQVRNIIKQAPKLKDIEFWCCDYKDLKIPPNSIIYADIPYYQTTKYKTAANFNYQEFYDWCRQKHNNGHKIFVSEYQMPPDFNCVWQKEMYSSLDLKGGKRNIERLFTL